MAPPRKRTQTKPADPEVVETPEALPEQVEAEEVETSEEAADSTAVDAEGDAASEPESADPEPAKPTKSDLQVVEAPCSACFPNGWPAVAFAVGCEHGTWSRPDVA